MKPCFEMNYTKKVPECELAALFLELSKALDSFGFHGASVTYDRNRILFSFTIEINPLTYLSLPKIW